MRFLDLASKDSAEESLKDVEFVAATFSNIVTVYHGTLRC